ncbi:hypothetical protein IKG45_03855 [Candidatus Saccharibacteria bacterium]|nr:hypothetical protein [Candidatus Saccharibacteria bacterium]
MVKKNESINWEAKEYIPHEKNAGWYVGLVIVCLALVALSIVFGWWTFAILVVLSGVVLVLYSVRPPRVLHYSLNSKGLSEGNRIYAYGDYKSFGVLKEGENFAIILTPRKRFAPGVKVYFPQESGEAIVDAFGARLPMEEVKLDFLDRVVNFLRI